MMKISSKGQHFCFIYYTILLLDCFPYSLKLNSDITLWVTPRQHWLQSRLGAIRHQAIIWTDDEWAQWHKLVSWGHGNKNLFRFEIWQPRRPDTYQVSEQFKSREVKDCLIRPYVRISACPVSYLCLDYEYKVGHSDSIPVKCQLNISCNLLSQVS